jgi:hypothetical protein
LRCVETTHKEFKRPSVEILVLLSPTRIASLPHEIDAHKSGREAAQKAIEEKSDLGCWG